MIFITKKSKEVKIKKFFNYPITNYIYHFWDIVVNKSQKKKRAETKVEKKKEKMF